MCKKPLVLAISLLCGTHSITVIAEEIKKANEETLSLEKCEQLYPEMENEMKQFGNGKVERLALVVGNQNYPGDSLDPENREWARLSKTHKDAEVMRDKFKGRDFHVLAHNEATLEDLKLLTCKVGFILKYHPVQTAAIFYSGHGLQDKIIPKDAKISFADKKDEQGNPVYKKDKEGNLVLNKNQQPIIEQEATHSKNFHIDNIIKVMAESEKEAVHKNKRNHIALFDSCRNGGDGKGGKGLTFEGVSGVVNTRAITPERPNNLIISYAAAPKQTAYENPASAYSFYTEALQKHLFNESVSVKTALNNVRANVYEETEKYIEEKRRSGSKTVSEKSQPQNISNDDSVPDFYLAGQQNLRPPIHN